MENTLDQFVDGIYEISQQDFSPYVYSEAKKCLLDYLGVTFAGAYEIKTQSQVALRNFNEHGKIPVIGLCEKSSLQNAILFNGIHSHVIELDDGHRVAMLHPGAPVFSALIPVAFKHNISGSGFLKGVIMGYEASVRLASAMQPSMKEKGFHGTGIAGAVGVAVAIANSLNFTKAQLKNAISAATTSASGILKIIKDISEFKPYNVGNAAQSGYTAAMLALSGFKGPYDTFGGKHGFLSIFSDNIKSEHLTFRNTDKLSINTIYRKPYAACRHCHAPIEAALNIKQNHNINTDNIREIEVRTYNLAVSGHDHNEIAGMNSAKMSIPYSVAVALIRSKAGINEFKEETINDNNILSLAKKIIVNADDELSKLTPAKRSAILNISTENNDLYSERVDYPKGEPENPLTDKELEDKFISLALFSGKTTMEIQNIISIVSNLETDFHKLLEYL